MSGAPPPTMIAGLLRQFGWYLSGHGARFIAASALIPLYATRMEPAEFGRLASVQVGSSILQIVVGLGIAGGLFRFLVEHRSGGEDAQGDAVLKTGLLAQLGLLGLASMIATPVVLLLGRAGVLEAWTGVLVLGAAFPVVGVVRATAEAELRARGQVRGWSIFATTYQAGLTAGVAAVLLAGSASAFQVMMVQTAVTGAFSAAGLVMIRGPLRRGAWSVPVLRRLMRFGVPTVPALISDWVTQFSDRFILGAFATLHEVGVYSLGWRMGQVAQQTLSNAALSAWDPFLFGRFRAPNGASDIGRAATYVALLGMAFILPLGAVARPFFEVIDADEAYVEMAPIVFFVALSYWMALVRHLLLAPTSTHVRTEQAIPLWATAAVVNVVLNLALIPPYGYRGAVAATVATYLLTMPMAAWIGRRIWAIEFEWRRLVTIGGAGVLAGVAVLAAPDGGPPAARLFLDPLASVLAFGALLLLFRFPSTPEWRLLRRSPA